MAPNSTSNLQTNFISDKLNHFRKEEPLDLTASGNPMEKRIENEYRTFDDDAFGPRSKDTFGLDSCGKNVFSVKSQRSSSDENGKLVKSQRSCSSDEIGKLVKSQRSCSSDEIGKLVKSQRSCSSDEIGKLVKSQRSCSSDEIGKLVKSQRSCSSDEKGKLVKSQRSCSSDEKGKLDHQKILKEDLASVVAQKWVKTELLPSKLETPVSFFLIMSHYYDFCKTENEPSLDPEQLLEIVRSKLSSLQYEDNDQKKPVEYKVHEMNNGGFGGSLGSDFAGCENINKQSLELYKSFKFQCAFKSWRDEGDASDSGVESSIHEDECHSPKDTDSCYESSDDSPCPDTGIDYVGKDVDDATEIKNINLGSDKEEMPLVVPQWSKSKYSSFEIILNSKGIKRELEPDPEPETGESYFYSLKLEKDSELRTNLKAKKSKIRGSIDRVSQELNLDAFENSPCIQDAKKFTLLFIKMLEKRELSTFLSMFTHSLSCKENHPQLCSMFKRIILHVAKSNHVCAVKEVYGHILRLHLDTCKTSDCGLPSCKNLREIRIQKSLQRKV